MPNHHCQTCNNAGRIPTGETEVFCACPAGKSAFRSEQRAVAALETWTLTVALVRREQPIREAA